MSEDPLKPTLGEIKGKAKERLERARTLTEWTGGERGYTVLSSGLEDYARDLFGSKEKLISRLKELAKKQKPVRILDYGCGTNQFARDLMEDVGSEISLEITGVSAGDPRSEEEQSIDKKKGILFINQKGPSFIPRTEFDLIVSETAFIHLPDPLRTLKALYGTLSKHGEMRLDYDRNGLAGGFYDGKNKDGAFQQADQILNDMRATGVKVDLLEQGMVLKKGPPRLVLKNLRYARNPNAPMNNGQYRLLTPEKVTG